MKALLAGLLLLVATVTTAETYHEMTYRQQTGQELSHLKNLLDTRGLEFTTERDVGNYFYSFNGYISRSAQLDIHGFNVGIGRSLMENHDVSVNYFGETIWERWIIQDRGKCKACTLEWVNTNWRQHAYLKYKYTGSYIQPTVEYHKVFDDRDELLKDRFYYGVTIKSNVWDKDVTFRVKTDTNMTTFNVGFRYD